MTETTYDRATSTLNPDAEYNDAVQNGIDNDPNSDAEKGATLGGIGGAVTGAIAGSMVGPVGAVIGAVIGGVTGGVASGAAVGAIDRVDNDNTVSGVGTTPSYRDNADALDEDEDDVLVVPEPAFIGSGMGTAGYAGTGIPTPVYSGIGGTADRAYDSATRAGNGIPGVQTGGYANDGTSDTRGVWEKTADAVTGDDVDDKTGRVVDHD